MLSLSYDAKLLSMSGPQSPAVLRRVLLFPGEKGIRAWQWIHLMLVLCMSSPEGQLQDRDLAPFSQLLWWCKCAITWASSGSVRTHTMHLALLWIPANKMQSLWSCWIAGVKFQSGLRNISNYLSRRRGKHNCIPWQKLGCRRQSGQRDGQ